MSEVHPVTNKPSTYVAFVLFTSSMFSHILFKMNNNYYVSVDGHAIDPEVGANVLAEGNYFNTVSPQIVFPLPPTSEP